MKKLISQLAVGLMISSLSVTAVSAEIGADKITGNTTQPVYAKYVEGVKNDSYKVVIGWGDMKFNYSESSKTWNTDTHDWDLDDSAKWTGNSDTSGNITITNHSSKDVVVSFRFDADTGSSLTGIFTGGGVADNAVTVGNALGGTEVAKTVTFTPDGTLAKTSGNAADYVSVGTITVTLN